MSLIRFRPARNLVTWPVHVDNLFNELWNTDTVWHPTVDLKETKDGYEIKAEIPGMNKDDITINYEDEHLTVSGERKAEKKDEKDNYYHVERMYGKFSRCFYIPGVKSEEITAKYKDGILTVQLQKADEVKPKEIAIS